MKLFIRLVILLVLSSGLVALIATEEQKQEVTERLGVSTKRKIESHWKENRPSKPLLKKIEKKRPVRRCDRVNSTLLNKNYTVYEWNDLNGRTQISDKRPISGYTKLRIKNLRVDGFFKLSIDNSQARLPAFTHGYIEKGVQKIYKSLTDVIKVAEVRATHLKLRFISDKKQFHAYRIKAVPDTSYKTTGFYTDRLNEATIWAVGNRDHITRIALHEATHAIVAGMFGGTPTWLNEGLASFFEKTVIEGTNIYSYSVINEHLRRLHSSRLPSLSNHFTQTHQQWHNDKKSDLNYAVDWSLVFYMMSSPQGRALLRYMLDNLAVNNCNGFDTKQFINQHYQGGLNRFERGWHKWLKSTRPNTTMNISF